MKPWTHALSSAKKFGGKAEDYIEIHNFMDSSKAHIADHRHRAVFHSSFGCFIVEKVFGFNVTNSEGAEVSTRDIAEQHILEDLGTIPSLQDYLIHMTIQPWMGGQKKKTTSLDELSSLPPDKVSPEGFTTLPQPSLIPLTYDGARPSTPEPLGPPSLKPFTVD